jgi:probable DNA repair protein
LFINNTKISSVLAQGGTVVVPSRQRAAAIRLAHSHAQLEQQLLQWRSCDVLPWSAWLERMAADARHGALRGLRRLNPVEEWLAWRAAAVEATAGVEILMPVSLADALRQSAARVRDGALHWPGSPTGESALLRRVIAIMARVCRERSAVLGDDWPLLLRDAGLSPVPLLFAGFEELGQALRARLLELGAVFDDATTVAAGGQHSAAGQCDQQLVAASDRHDELRRAAQWSRQLLGGDPGARVLIIVPRLAQCRALAVQAFDHALNGSEVLAGEPRRGRYALEGGVPLGDYPLVAAALALLALGSGALEFAQLAALLRSSFLHCGTAAARAALELRLRDRNVLSANVAQLLGVVRTAATPWSADFATALGALEPALARDAAIRQHAGGWARAFAAQLELWGWPGAQSLASAEQQQRERFEALLGEFAALGQATGPLSAAAAVELLRTMAARTLFEPATDDAAVTLSAACGDPLLHYDGIWVTGLNAGEWPAPVQADPFIPIAVQRAAQLPGASPAAQLALAHSRLAAWRERARTLVLSYACVDDDVSLQPSSLLRVPVGAADNNAAPHAVPVADPLIMALRASARLEPRPLERALAWPLQRKLPRGTRALDLQAACPFRAAAELRLDAAPLPKPRPGLDMRERGRVLHRALELVWRQLDGSQSLRACDAGALQALALRATTQSLAEILAVRTTALSPALHVNERARTTGLIVALLEQEKARADFHVDELEVSRVHTLAGAQIRVRMDRVDRVGDGRSVIDYKSGALQSFTVGDERPRNVQLLVYAALVGAPLVGVAAVHLQPSGIEWRGAAADSGVFPALSARRAAAAPWAEVLPYAQRTVEHLVRGFVAGDAEVAPRPQACEHCHLAGLCRIDSARLALEELAVELPGAAAESGAADES